MSFHVGQVIDKKYEVLSLLGHGGMGSVFKARHIPLARDVAIKAIGCVFDDVQLKRFEREAMIISALQHRNIVQFYGFGVWQSTPYIVMECIDGQSLETYIAERGRLTELETLQIGLQMCDALACAHANDVIHRDLKPANVILSAGRGESKFAVKLIDFGLSLPKTDNAAQQKLTDLGSVVGTALYMSPEQCLGEEIDSRADIYSIGCILAECLLGVTPFDAEHTVLILQKHVQTPAAELRRILDAIDSEELKVVLVKALTADRAQRYQSCKDLAEDISIILSGGKPTTTDNPKLLPKLPRRVQLLAVSALLLLGCLISIGIYLHPEPTRTPSTAVYRTAIDLEKRGNFVAALDSFLTSVELDHQDHLLSFRQRAVALNHVETSLMMKGRVSEGIDAIKQFIQLYDNNHLSADSLFFDSLSQHAERLFPVGCSEEYGKYLIDAVNRHRSTESLPRSRWAESTANVATAVYTLNGDNDAAESLLQGLPEDNEIVAMAYARRYYQTGRFNLVHFYLEKRYPFWGDREPLMMRMAFARGDYEEVRKFLAGKPEEQELGLRLLMAAHDKNWRAAGSLAAGLIALMKTYPAQLYFSCAANDLDRYIALLKRDGQTALGDQIADEYKSLEDKCHEVRSKVGAGDR